MTARWQPCLCGHRRDAHHPVKDGGTCEHPGCDCRRYQRPRRPAPVTAPPGQPRVAQPRLNYHRT